MDSERKHHRTFTRRELEAVFGEVAPEAVAKAVAIIDGRTSPMEVDAAMSWWSSCYTKPEEWGPEMKLEALNALLDGFGSERVSTSGSAFAADGLLYVNRGDTYATTLLFDEALDEFTIGSWGDWIEVAEQNEEEE